MSNRIELLALSGAAFPERVTKLSRPGCEDVIAVNGGDYCQQRRRLRQFDVEEGGDEFIR